MWRSIWKGERKVCCSWPNTVDSRIDIKKVTFNTIIEKNSVWRQSSRKSMTNELISCIKELRCVRHSKDRIRMHISFWCRITLTIPEAWLKGTPKDLEASTGHWRLSAPPILAWVSSFREWVVALKQRLTAVSIFHPSDTKAEQWITKNLVEVEPEWKVKEKTQASNTRKSVNSTTSSTWIVLRRQLKWWENSTNQLRSWRWLMIIRTWLTSNLEAVFSHRYLKVKQITVCILHRKTLFHNNLTINLEEERGLIQCHRLHNTINNKILLIKTVNKEAGFSNLYSKTRTELQLPKTILLHLVERRPWPPIKLMKCINHKTWRVSRNRRCRWSRKT